VKSSKINLKPAEISEVLGENQVPGMINTVGRHHELLIKNDIFQTIPKLNVPYKSKTFSNTIFVV